MSIATSWDLFWAPLFKKETLGTYLAAQGTYYLLRKSTYPPGISSLGVGLSYLHLVDK